MENDFIKIGAINLPGKVDVTDPCYDKYIWCRETYKVVPGEYLCYFHRNDANVLDRCRIIHNDPETLKKVEDNRSWRSVGAAGVDAGMAGFFDNKPDFPDAVWGELCSQMYPDGSMRTLGLYNQEDSGVYIANSDTDTELFEGREGFWTESGYGDGEYPIYAVRNNRVISALELRFA